MVGVTPIGPGCLLKVLRGPRMSSHVLRVFLYRITPYRLLRIVLQTLGGTIPAFLMFCRDSIVRGNAHPWSIYLLMDLSSASELSNDWGDLWFTLSIIASKSYFLVSSLIGSIW